MQRQDICYYTVYPGALGGPQDGSEQLILKAPTTAKFLSWELGQETLRIWLTLKPGPKKRVLREYKLWLVRFGKVPASAVYLGSCVGPHGVMQLFAAARGLKRA